MKLNLKKFLKSSSVAFFAFALAFVFAQQAHAAADITIVSATVTSATTISVTVGNLGGDSVTGVDVTKWHIDRNTGGSSPLDPSSFSITNAPGGVFTLTFAGGSFTDTATAYDASHGLYADASAVTDGGASTNAVVGHAASVAIADGQKPTFTANRTALNTIVLTFSETVDAADTATAAWTVAGATVTGATDPASSTTLTLTTTGLTSTSSTPAVTYVAGSGTVADISAATNEVANSATANAADQVKPTFTASRTALNTIVLTFSENVDASDTATAAWTVAGATVTVATDPANSTTLTLTTTGLTSTSSTPAVNYVAASGTVVDAATNEVADGGSVSASDHVAPTFTADRTAVNTIVLTFSEPVTGTAILNSFTVAGASAVTNTAVTGGTSVTLTTTGLTATDGTPNVGYVSATGDILDNSAATNEVANGGAIASTDHVPPTVAVTLSDHNLSHGDHSTVTFTFSEDPTGFTSGDVTVGNGNIGTIDATDPLVETAILTPSSNTNDLTNVISVGTGWTDSSPATNAPAGSSSSENYTVDTKINTGGGGGGSGGGHVVTVTPAVPANDGGAPLDCTAGVQFSPSTGRNCHAATPASPALINSPHFAAYNFGTVTLKNGSQGDAVKELQKFLNAKLNLGLVLDGKLGPKTIAVIKKWQSDHKLVADGLVGPKTKAQMNLEAEAS